MGKQVEQLHVLIEGMVQGVGFRHATLMEAQSRSLTGWVRNLSDGRVEAVFEGPHDVLQGMLQWCERGPFLAEVRSVQPEWREAEGRFAGFRIAFGGHA